MNYTCDWTYNDQPLRRVVRFVQVVKQKARKEEMPQMVGSNTEFKAISSICRFPGSWQVNRSIANKHIQWPAWLPKVINKLPHTIKRCKVQMHNSVVFLSNAGRFRSPFGFEEIPAGHYHMPLSCLSQSLSSGQA